MGAVGQPVAVFGSAGTTEDPVEQVGVAGTKAAGLFGADHSAEQRFGLRGRPGPAWAAATAWGWP